MYEGKRKAPKLRKYIEGGYKKDFEQAKILLEQDKDGNIVIHPDDMLKEFQIWLGSVSPWMAVLVVLMLSVAATKYGYDRYRSRESRKYAELQEVYLRESASTV